MAEAFESYESALEWLFYGLPSKPHEILKDQANLEQSARLMRLLGDPQNETPTIHVAATSGKGSIVWLTADILRRHNFDVGALMSPHVYDFRERFLINGKFVAKKEVLSTINELKNLLVEQWGSGPWPTYFQMVTGLAYLIFKRHEVDYLVVETGVGGKFDATNTITNCEKIAVLGQIGLDHTRLLGDNVADIAKQKAGITGCCSRVIALRQTAEINGIFKSAAGRSKINIEFIEPSGDYQKDNLALARQACETVAERDGWKLSRPVASAAFKAFRLPGRFETRAVNGKTVVLDGAHNPQKITNLVERLQKQFPDKKFVTLLSTGKERDITELMSLLAPITSQFVLTRYRTLAEHNRKASHNLQGLKLSRFVYEIIDDLPSAVKRLVDSTEDYLVTGSFYLVGEVGPLLP